MKKIAFLIILYLPFLGCKCRLAINPLPTVYRSIAISKENKAFINEFQPESPFLRMGGRKYYIEEAWVEHAHLERNFRRCTNG